MATVDGTEMLKKAQPDPNFKRARQTMMGASPAKQICRMKTRIETGSFEFQDIENDQIVVNAECGGQECFRQIISDLCHQQRREPSK